MGLRKLAAQTKQTGVTLGEHRHGKLTGESIKADREWRMPSTHHSTMCCRLMPNHSMTDAHRAKTAGVSTRRHWLKGNSQGITRVTSGICRPQKLPSMSKACTCVSVAVIC